MIEQEMELNLGRVLSAILQKYEKLEIVPEYLLNENTLDYQLRIDYNDETKMLEIRLEKVDES